MRRIPLSRRIASRIDISSAGCWVWQGGKCRQGYAKITIRGDGTIRAYILHRFMYRLIRGGIPDGLQLDHLCRNRACINPFHLQPVTAMQNITRGQTGLHNSGKTHCIHGHEFTPENTRLVKTYEGYGLFGRQCRACGRIRDANRRPRRQGLKAA